MTSDETVSQFLRANHWAGAWTFFRELDEMSEDAQLHLLRAHGAGEAAIRDPAEIALRDRADNLLAILELVEVALTAGYLSIESSALRDSVMPVFGNEALFRYATTTYPVPLYGQLKSRVESGDGPVEPDERAARRLFLRFHDLNVAVEFDADVTQFLRFLDDYQIGAANLGEVLRVARNPDEAIVRFAERPADRSPLGRGLHGLRKFLEFCESLDELVHPQPAGDEVPLLRRAIYQHYEYWIERLGTRGVIDAIGVSPEASPFEFDQFAPSDAFSEAESDRDLRNSLGRLLTSEHRASVSETSPPAGGSL